MLGCLRVVFFLWTTTCLFGDAVTTAPSSECDCSQAGCECAAEPEVDRPRTRREVLETAGRWQDTDLSPTGEQLKRRAPPDDSALNAAVFRWGKRTGGHDDAHALNAVFRWGKRNDDVTVRSNVFRWGKRSGDAATDLTPPDYDLQPAGSDVKRIFRWGKRAGEPSASVFRWGKRSREGGNPPVFRWGKRDFRDDLDSHLRTVSLFQWPGKRIDEGKVTSDTYTPVFRWGKRQPQTKTSRPNTASLFRWGKRSIRSVDRPVNVLDHFTDS